ncbi:right-handed parallel beta-helix repeat-containing protein [Haloprofundus salilacus]|uniref:right-handed parallel beta-helix repeat-containing protein n=1 Tax=Haloprofundus salilacus TaxID=2876190 RepID=UPI001CCA2073|nr:right-handed parallel beta-helix repeat-containing protein [Haloprofundus salilacus]
MGELSRRGLLALVAAGATSTPHIEKAPDGGWNQFRPGERLRITGGETDGDGEPPASASKWDVYLGTTQTDNLLPFVSTQDGWRRHGLTTPSVNTGRIRGVADHVVRNDDELERAFKNLSAGETIRIDPKNAPYRTTSWLDVDADGVTVVGAGVPTLVKPADEANVGGIRIGHNSRCHDVTVRDVGYHGNTENQDDAAKKLHGIIVRDASNVVLRGNSVTRTHPYREHGDGGSGISVERGSQNVRVVDNRIREYGDRGIQLGGQNIFVSGNIVTEGTDRAIACDLWSPGGTNEVANTVIITSNIVGNSHQGSLTGIATGAPGASDDGAHVTITDNIGFGYHKSFCHVRGPGAVHNVTIRGNVSVHSTEGLRTNQTTKFAGVAIDPEKGGRNITVAGNKLVGYSRHGVNIQSPVSDFEVTNNILTEPAEVGIRIKWAENGRVDGNTVTSPGEDGILLDEAKAVSVRNNRVRGAVLPGITVEGGSGGGHELADNYLHQREDADPEVPGVLVGSSETVVSGNTIRQTGDVALLELRGASHNLYTNNRAVRDEGQAGSVRAARALRSDGSLWRIQSASAHVRDHTPAFDSHRGLTPSGGTLRVQFQKPYVRRPKLSFGRRGGGVESVRYRTNDAGAFVGATLSVSGDRPVDLFVESP